jgi:hypothetical protein
MFRSSIARTAAIAVLVLIGLGLLRYKPWRHSGAAGLPGGGGKAATIAEGARPRLTVGFLPVT